MTNIMITVYIKIFLSLDPGRLARSKLVFKVLKLVNLGGWALEILFLIEGIPAGSYSNQFQPISLFKGVLASYRISIGLFVCNETREGVAIKWWHGLIWARIHTTSFLLTSSAKQPDLFQVTTLSFLLQFNTQRSKSQYWPSLALSAIRWCNQVNPLEIKPNQT